jgi:uncharacterized membrane protein
MEFIQAILRLLQLLWLLLITALIGNVIASNINASSSNESAINFTMFVAVLSWLAALYGLATAVIESLAIPVVMLALDGLATLFTVIDGIVLAAKLGARNCGGDIRNLGDGWLGYGSSDDVKRCREVQASTVFMWFLFATFVAALAFTLVGFRRSGTSVRSNFSRPHMAQVGA